MHAYLGALGLTCIYVSEQFAQQEESEIGRNEASLCSAPVQNQKQAKNTILVLLAMNNALYTKKDVG